MGHREDLLEGAKRCLYERGYARTTARDIVAASGTNLASIGYHFGSKDTLLNTAMMEAFNEWGAELGQALPSEDSGDDRIEELVATWRTITKSHAEQRPLWAASIEVYAQAQYAEDLRAQLAATLEQIRLGLADDIRKSEDGVSEQDARKLGAVQLALLTGLMMQWLINPEQAPSPEDVDVALRMIAGQRQNAPDES